MSMSNAAEQALLDLLFLNQDWANIGDAGGLQNSATAGSFYISLHSSDPDESGNQETNELSYTGYARVAVARSGSGWSRSGSTISNVSAVQFEECTSGSGTATHFSIGTLSTGTGQIILSGALTASRSISAGITPLFNAGQLTATVD
jgi:hypothetical protein